jgi:hypothetical protein
MIPFTDDDNLAYSKRARAEALEEAAKIADKVAGRRDTNDFEYGKISAAEEIASDIRALKDK